MYHSFKGSQIQTCLTTAYETGTQTEEKISLPHMFGCIDHIQYPLMAYYEFYTQKISVCNLAINSPQLLIDISPYTFVCFVNQGMTPNGSLDDTLKNGMVQFIYFLGKKGKELLLLRIVKMCWDQDKKGDIEIVKQGIQFDSNQHSLIKQAFVFSTVKVTSLTADYLILRS